MPRCPGCSLWGGGHKEICQSSRGPQASAAKRGSKPVWLLSSPLQAKQANGILTNDQFMSALRSFARIAQFAKQLAAVIISHRSARTGQPTPAALHLAKARLQSTSVELKQYSTVFSISTCASGCPPGRLQAMPRLADRKVLRHGASRQPSRAWACDVESLARRSHCFATRAIS